MLQYRRRNTKDRLEISHSDYTHPLLTYCNWSFDKAYHINLTTLQSILNTYDADYIPFYLRIFNEVPTNVLKSFLSEYTISRSSLKEIHRRLKREEFLVRNF
jgi:hypothetical protein